MAAECPFFLNRLSRPKPSGAEWVLGFVVLLALALAVRGEDTRSITTKERDDRAKQPTDACRNLPTCTRLLDGRYVTKRELRAFSVRAERVSRQERAVVEAPSPSRTLIEAPPPATLQTPVVPPTPAPNPSPIVEVPGPPGPQGEEGPPGQDADPEPTPQRSFGPIADPLIDLLGIRPVVNLLLP